MSQIIDPQEDIVFFFRVEGCENVAICGKGDLPAFDLTGSMRPDTTSKSREKRKGS
jgi:hypothetical protein